MQMSPKAENISQEDSFWHGGKRQLGQLATANLILPVLAGFFGIALIAQTTDNIILPSVSGRK